MQTSFYSFWRRLGSSGLAVLAPLLLPILGWGQVVISQVYGGGGNTNATYQNDFIELHNLGSSVVSVNGWSVQYTGDMGTTRSVTSLSNSSIPASEYYLVQENTGTGGTTSLPTPDVTGVIAMNTSSAKVALVNSTIALNGACPIGGSIIDFIGYGTTANCSETAPAPTSSNTASIVRAGGGCVDNNNNSTDFSVTSGTNTFTLRNSSTSPSVCPIITVSAAALTSFTTTQGTASAFQSYTVSEGNLSANVFVVPPPGYELTKESATPGTSGTFTSTALSFAPTSASLAATPIYAQLAATATVAGSPYTGNIVHSSTGATNVNKAVSGTVTAAATTIVTNAITGSPFCVGQTQANNTVTVSFTVTGTVTTGNVYTAYLGTGTTTPIGTLSSTASGSLSIAGALPSSLVSGTSYRIRVDASAPATTGTDNGTDLAVVNYKNNEVTAYTATPGNATVALAWTNPPTCVTRVVIIARQGSAVSVSPLGAFTANAAFGSGTNLGTPANPNQYVVYDGPGTSTTVTSLTNISRYYFMVFTSNGDGFSNGSSVLATPTVPLPFTEVLLPQLLAGHPAGATTHTDRLPYVFRATLSSLTANATYHYYNTAVETTDEATNIGTGSPIFPVGAGGFVRTINPGLSTAGNYGTLTADATGTYTGWFILEPTGSARFDAGKALQMRLVLNDGNGGTFAASYATIATTVAVRQLGAAPTQATGVQGISRAPASNFVFTYDNPAGTGRPLAGTFVESDGSANTLATFYATFYAANVEAQAGAWGLLTANDNANGIRRIEQRNFATGALAGCAATSSIGTWPSGTATASPSGGGTPLVITQLDAPLTCEVLAGFNPATTAVLEGNTGTTTVLLNVTVSGTPASPLTVTVANAGTGTATAGTDYTFATQMLTFAAAGTQTVSLTIIGERLPEANETVQLSLTTSGTPATIISSLATATILDDDTAAPTLLLEEDFDYVPDTKLADNNTSPSTTTGWKAHSGNGTNNIPTLASSLTQPQYPQGATPATSAQAQLTNNGQDISKPFATPTTLGILYYTAVVNVSAAQTGGDYFFHLYDNTSGGSSLRGRVFARSTTGGGINFGVSVSGDNAAATWGLTDYQLNTKYLLVMKYNTNGTATVTSDDVMSLYVLDNTSTPATEPAGATASTGPDATAAAVPAGLNAVALRQGNATGTSTGPAAATLTLDGIRVATNWGTAVGRPTFTTPNGGFSAYTDAITLKYVGNYYDVTVNNSDQVSVSGTVTIENNLTLTSGLVFTNATNLLRLASAATVLGGSAASFVSGPLARMTPAGIAAATNFGFPVGKGSFYRPFTLNLNTQGAASTYTVEQIEGNPNPSGAANLDLTNGLGSAPLKRVSQFRAFTLASSTTGNATGTITLSFGTGDRVNSPGDAGLVVAVSSGGSVFGNLDRSTLITGPSLPGGPDVAGTLTSKPIPALVAAATFVLGATNENITFGQAVNPLPVELTSFTAQRQADKTVSVKWVTASEKNSVRFEVQRSLDGREYALVASAAAQGNSDQVTIYAAHDKTVPAGRLYYRLRQVDLDGTSTFSPVVLVAGAGSIAKVQLYPNPAHTALHFTAAIAQAYRVLNQLGQPLLHGITEAGTASIGIEALPTGLYFLELQTAAGRTVQKFEKTTD